jgi:hypothetical protein
MSDTNILEEEVLIEPGLDDEERSVPKIPPLSENDFPKDLNEFARVNLFNTKLDIEMRTLHVFPYKTQPGVNIGPALVRDAIDYEGAVIHLALLLQKTEKLISNGFRNMGRKKQDELLRLKREEIYAIAEPHFSDYAFAVTETCFTEVRNMARPYLKPDTPKFTKEAYSKK